MGTAPTPTVRVLVVAYEPADLGMEVDLERAADLTAGLERLGEGGIDIVLVPFDGDPGPIVAVRERAPDVPVIAVSDDENGQAALDAGAHDYVAPDADANLLRRSIRYARALHRLEGEVRRRQVVDELTGLFNARGFEQLSLHHLRMADRTKKPVVLVFVRLDNLREVGRTHGSVEEARMLAEIAGVLHQAVRGSDVLARVGEEIFCVLLTGEATGAEALVLSRLVEAVAAHTAQGDRPYPLSLSVGAATYDPATPVSLQELMAEADRRMRSVAGTTPPATT